MKHQIHIDYDVESGIIIKDIKCPYEVPLREIKKQINMMKDLEQPSFETLDKIDKILQELEESRQ